MRLTQTDVVVVVFLVVVVVVIVVVVVVSVFVVVVVIVVVVVLVVVGIVVVAVVVAVVVVVFFVVVVVVVVFTKIISEIQRRQRLKLSPGRLVGRSQLELSQRMRQILCRVAYSKSTFKLEVRHRSEVAHAKTHHDGENVLEE